MGISVESTEWLFSPLFPGRIGIWKCWFLWREENRSTRRKTLGARTRTNNKLNPRMTQSPGIEPRPRWWEASALTTAPSLLPKCLGSLSSLTISDFLSFFFSAHDKTRQNVQTRELSFFVFP